MTPLLEICVDTLNGLNAAITCGADRIELCAALSEGGLTPSRGFMALAAEAGCPVRAMIRPRAGDFTYSGGELAVMRADIAAVAEAGLAGVVFGANQADGALDLTALEDLCRQAQDFGLETALHRSFDLTPDPSAALEVAIALGFDTVLTSGGAASAPEGVATLQALVAQAAGRIEILAGGGVRADSADGLLRAGVLALHASCRAPLPLRRDRATELGYVTPDLRDTDAAQVRALRARLNETITVLTGEIA
ncbi:copper homeostasis protein CutC [Asticcacaulis taihuensis]|uniref:copper homeostasis protein CutC n=1 Tax=Asticcacaulis taihuensis TaxID=260084 RepID=UPI003F7C411D